MRDTGFHRFVTDEASLLPLTEGDVTRARNMLEKPELDDEIKCVLTDSAEENIKGG